MREIHPSEADLACLSELLNDSDLDGEVPNAEMIEHLRWCTDCRSVVADHHWLRKKVTTTLAIAADAVSVPRPKWWVVQ